MLVKIVHPGGHVELHDRPVLATEVMIRNPKCCVAHPDVFQQPWVIIEPETTLMPGKNFYVVPIGTIRKLQRNALKYSPSLVRQIRSAQSSKGEEEDNGAVSFPNITIASSMKPNADKQCCFSDDSCFMGLLKGIRSQETGEEYSSQETGSPSSSNSSSEVKPLTRKRPSDFTRPGIKGSPKKLASLDHWQPSLESIKEE